MADMTGFNPDVAKQELEAFKEYGTVVSKKTHNVYYNFLKALQDNWCSPKAREFSIDYLLKLHAFGDNIETLYSQIYRSAVDAYNIIARANGWAAMSLEAQNEWNNSYNEAMGGEVLREANETGVVGMNVANVQLARGVYLDEMKAVIQLMNDTPMNIAFYDPEGAQQAAYKNEIQTRVTDMNEKIDEAMAALSSAMETEENTILIAKDSAAGTMAT